MNLAALRFFLVSSVLAVILALYLTIIRNSPPPVLTLVCGISLLGCFLVVFTRSLGFSALGVAICLLPSLGTGALSLFVAAWLLAAEFKRLIRRTPLLDACPVGERLLLLAFLAVMLSLLGGLIQTVLLNVDFIILSTLLDNGGAYAFLRYAGQAFAEWRSLALLVAGYVLPAFLTFSLLKAEGEGEEGVLGAVVAGLAVGALGAVLVLILQFRPPTPLVTLNQTAFWQMVGRYSASFSDPNAFGLMAALLVPLLFFSGRGKRRLMYAAVALLLLCVSPWSGSRTIWIALFLWLILLSVRVVRAHFKGRAFGPLALLVILLPLLGFAGLGYPPLNDRLEAYVSAPGLKRVLKTLDWSDGEQMFASRFIYGRIALAMWSKHPWVGVGLDRFYSLQTGIAEEIGVELNGWRDNANNFYLQVLSEQGLVGLSLTLFSFYLFSLALRGRPLEESYEDSGGSIGPPSRLLFVSRTSLAVLLLLLFTGPHFFFEEVRFLAVILLALGVSHAVPAVEPKRLRSFKRILLSAALICPIIYSVSFASAGSPNQIRGLYAKEHGEDGFFAWTAQHARFAVCRDESELIFRALNPDLETRPVRVSVFRKVNGEKVPVGEEVVLSTTEWKTLSLSLTSDDGPSHILVLEVSHTWSPNRAHGVGDWRELGVMLKWPEALCLEQTADIT